MADKPLAKEAEKLMKIQKTYELISYQGTNILYKKEKGTMHAKKCRAETNIRNVANEPFSKRTNIRIFVRFDD